MEASPLSSVSCQAEAEHLTRPRDQDFNLKEREKQSRGDSGIH